MPYKIVGRVKGNPGKMTDSDETKWKNFQKNLDTMTPSDAAKAATGAASGLDYKALSTGQIQFRLSKSIRVSFMVDKAKKELTNVSIGHT